MIALALALGLDYGARSATIAFMARTAPIPNIPAIPGMNPGVWIMGGGAGGGGGSGSGDGSAGDQGAGGDNGGSDAGGDGRGAGGCGTGSPGSCNNCGNRMSAGDPVDVGTGAVFTLPVLDVFLPGPLPLRLTRQYTTNALRSDVGLGPGWSHDYAMEILVRRRTVVLADGTGSTVVLDLPDPGGRSSARGWEIVRDASGFSAHRDGRTYAFGLHDEPGSRHLLTAIVDGNQNRITLSYEGTRLASIVDSVGRTVIVRQTPEGRIRSFEVKNAGHQGQWIRLVEMTYDTAGRLVETRDPLGHVVRYTYDEGHRMTSFTQPDRPTFHFRYDDEGRCVETWGAMPDGTVPGLADDVPAFLADGETPAKGIFHSRITYQPDGYREVADSRHVRRVFTDARGLVTKGVQGGNVTTREFDENGFLISHTDANQATTRYQRDARGEVVATQNALGQTTLIERDEAGRPREAHDELGTFLRIRYDAHGNPIEIVAAGGEATARTYDDRGLLVEQIHPDGTRTRHAYDEHGNRVEVTEPGGHVFRYRYDWLGRCVAQVDPRGAETRFTYDDAGRSTSTIWPNGGVERRTYNGVDELVELVEPDGQVWRARWLLRRMTDVTHPGGATIRYRYDREGLLTTIVNEKGETRRHRHNDAGLVTEVTSFDGRKTLYDFDAMNRIVKYTNGRGEVTKLERDPLGRIVEIAYPDDTKVAFEYDARGQLVRAEGPGGTFTYDLDAAGQILRETHALGGEETSVEHAYDVLRRPASIKSSRGAEHKVRRDERGATLESLIDEVHRIGFSHDAVGRELSRALPGGAIVRSDYGIEGGYSRRLVLRPRSRPRTGPGEPDWVGESPDDATVRKAFQYTKNAENVLARWDEGGVATRYEYDGREQLAAVMRGQTIVEAFRYDEAGNVHEAGSPREYGRGNVLLAKGDARYRWDEDGRLVEKTTLGPGGEERVHRYAWNGQGYLKEVQTPEGTIVEFKYDPFARRVEKRVRRARTGRDAAWVSTTRYIWDKSRIFQEIRRSADERGDPVVEETTYYWDQHDGTPLAQRTDVLRGDTRERGDLLFHVNDPSGTPEELVSGDGRVVAEMHRKAFGATNVTPEGEAGTRLRFPGQIEDPETGLHYNRYRYYDPDLGRYISVDPAGGLPDANEYRYCLNPIGWTDPFGLAHLALATFTPAGSNQSIDMNGGNLYESRYDCEPDNFSRGYNQQLGISPANNFYSRDANGRLAHRTSDTEAQILRDLQGMHDSGQVNLQGGRLTIVGERPPCEACHDKMQAMAQTHGMNIDYHWTGVPGARRIADRTPGSRHYP